MTAVSRRSNPFPPGMAGGFLLLFWLQAGVAAAQNLAANPGFETGTTADWLAFGSPTISIETNQVHSGADAGLVTNRTATWNGAAQSFLGVLQSNQTYNVSVWLQLASGAAQTMQITAQQVDGGGTSYKDIAEGPVSAGAWTQLAGQFTLNISNSLTSLIFYFEMPSSSNASYYVDDLLVQAVGPAPTNGSCTVDGGTVHQRIDGFGASSAWQSAWTTAEADMFFSTNHGTGLAFNGTNFPFTGIGLSLLRSRIAPVGTTVENSIMQLAQARGAKVWSTPWSPAAGFKSNGNVDGGSFVGNAANYQAYASQLAGYVVNMKNSYGVNVYAVSVQNEPDAQVTGYESCNWSAQQIHDFVPYLYQALVASNAGAVKIMLPESQNWTDPSNLVADAMSDSTSNDVAIVAEHDYVANNDVGDLAMPAAINSYGKARWETEVSLLSGSDSSLTNALYYAGRIHAFLTSAQVNAWHYWWLMPYATGNEGLTDTNGVPAARMYALGQFSRFVRPGYYRIDVANNTGAALISAYKDSLSPGFAMVAINTNPTPIAQTFSFTNLAGVSTVTPWLTTSNLSLASQMPVAVTNSSFTYWLPAFSIATFVGQSAGSSPPFFPVAIANQAINPDVTLTLTNSASDTNTPPPTLAYTLLNGPTNATLNASNGVFVWRPLLSQANTTNLVAVQAADASAPGLTATNVFTITVHPVILPVASASVAAGGRVNVVIAGARGPDYGLLVSTNLSDWQLLFSTNAPALPVTFGDPNQGHGPARFYRIQMGP